MLLGRGASQEIIKGDSRDSQQWDPLMLGFQYYSHTMGPISLGILMGGNSMGKGFY